MTSTPLPITPLRREHIANYYTSDAVMTSTAMGNGVLVMTASEV
jgi:hypothetical protein